MIDAVDLGRVQREAGDGEVVDLVSKGLQRGEACGALQGGKDRAEMGDDYDVGDAVGPRCN